MERMLKAIQELDMAVWTDSFMPQASESSVRNYYDYYYIIIISIIIAVIVDIIAHHHRPFGTNEAR
jgi:hypothetical protein